MHGMSLLINIYEIICTINYSKKLYYREGVLYISVSIFHFERVT